MHDLIPTQTTEPILKYLTTGVLTLIFSGVIWIAKVSWKVSAKVTKFDKSLEDQANSLINHIVDDGKEFSIVAKALDSQQQAFEKMQDKYDKLNTMIERFIGSAETHFENTKERFNRIENDMRKT